MVVNNKIKPLFHYPMHLDKLSPHVLESEIQCLKQTAVQKLLIGMAINGLGSTYYRIIQQIMLAIIFLLSDADRLINFSQKDHKNHC